MGSKPIGISASRGAAVLGLSQFSTPVDVWEQIMEDRKPGFCSAHGIVPPEPVDNAAVRWGLGFETAVIQLAEIARGMKIGEREKLCELESIPSLRRVLPGAKTFDDTEFDEDFRARIIEEARTFPPITCHLDGRYEDGVLHEGKTTSAFAFRDAWGEPGTDRVPRAYQVQAQHQMLCTEASQAIISVLVFPTRVEEWEDAGLRVREFPEVEEYREHGHLICRVTDDVGALITPDGNFFILSSATGWALTLRDMGFFHQYPISENHELQALMLERYQDFWARYVLTETPPPAETYEDIKRLIPQPRGTVVADEQQERWASEYKQIGDESAKSKKRQDQLKTLLIGGIDRGAEHPIDSDSVEAIVLRDRQGKKIASYSKGADGRKTFRCGG